MSCAEGDTGFIYAGKLGYEVIEVSLDNMPEIPVKIAMNVGNPQLAFDFAQLPNDGVGLARLEFIISNTIGIHPKACLEYETLPTDLKLQVAKQSRGYAEPDALLRGEDRRGRGDDRRRILAEEGHRATLGLQVERIPQPDRWRALRAARGEPDARLPRRFALHRGELPRLLQARVRGDEAGSRRHGPHQRRDHDPVRAHAAGSGNGASRS